MSQHRTRSSSSHSVFGNPLPQLPNNELPTRWQVGSHCQFLKESKFQNNKDVAPQVAQSLIDLWKRASIPPQQMKNVKVKVLRFMEEASAAAKHGKHAEKTKKFEDSLGCLFDIAACQCEDLLTCKCVKEIKVPAREREFLIDQRTVRRMQIGPVDVPVTALLSRREERESRMSERKDKEKRRKLENEQLVSSLASSAAETLEFCSSPEDIKTDTDSVEDEMWSVDRSSDNRNTTPIPTVALEAERFGVSNRAAAAISTAALIDYGIVSPDDRSNVVDHHKVWRARQQLRKDMKQEALQSDDKISAVFFDGKKDMTLVKEKKESKWYSSKQVEDHYVLVGEPGTVYLKHISLEAGTGSAIADGLHASVEEIGLKEMIMAVGADSTPVNTGPRGGAIHLFECQVGRPVQWLICCLHLNELPLRHLCKNFIGPSEGPAQWKGPIGKALADCETLPKAEFQVISDGDPIQDIDTSDLSRDQCYLFNIITAIRSGVISDDLLRQKPGPMSNARWLTTASRICRLYVSTSHPSCELQSLTQFIVTNYGPMWFQIKCHPKCTDGPKHLLKQIKVHRLLPEASRNVTWPVIQRNAYWAHQENVLLAMLADDDIRNRESAVEIIKSIRVTPHSSQQTIREFRPPLISSTNETMQDLLPPLAQCLYEPPLTRALSDSELDNFVLHPFTVNIPCHSQGVERCVRLVTEASNAVYGVDARDGYIRAVMKSRSFMPSFNSKEEFCAPTDD